MSDLTPQNRLSKPINIAYACSVSLKNYSVVCSAINSADVDDVACAFSDILNNIYDQIKVLKHSINLFNRKLNETSEISDKSIVQILEKRDDLQKVYHQMEDFSCLMDCTIEESDKNPRIFAGYFSNSIEKFSTEIFNISTAIERLAV